MSLHGLVSINYHFKHALDLVLAGVYLPNVYYTIPTNHLVISLKNSLYIIVHS